MSLVDLISGKNSEIDLFGTSGRGSKLDLKCKECFYIAIYEHKFMCDLTEYYSYGDSIGMPYYAKCINDKSALSNAGEDRFKAKING